MGFQSCETAKICENVTSNMDVSANNTERLSDSLMNLAAMLRRTAKCDTQMGHSNCSATRQVETPTVTSFIFMGSFIHCLSVNFEK